MFAIKSFLSAAVVGSAALAGTVGQRTANADVCGPVYIGRPSIISTVPAYCPPVYTVSAYTPVYAAPTYYPAPTVVYQSPYVYTAPDCGPRIIIRDHDDHHDWDRDHDRDHRVIDRRDYDRHDYHR